MTQKTISDFLSSEYKEFAFYSIEGRALASCIDGFKPVHRKIMHTSNLLWKTGNEKTLKVFQLSGKIASDCLHYDSEILLADGDTIKIGDWFNKYMHVKLEVVCIDEDGNITTSIGHNPKASLQKYVYEIETEDGKIHKLSGNHLVMLTDNTYKKVSELTELNELKNILENIKIKNIKKIILDTPEYYYDISVEKYNNFIINENLVVHNCYYHHGDSSLSGAIVTLAQTFKNNVPFLTKDGQFGSLRSPQASAARYIGASLSENFRLIYKDFDLLTYKEEEGESIEPEFFLPIIPTILLNGSQGIAVGFASNILNRNIIDIIEACIKVLNNKKISEIKPYLNDFIGEYIQSKENNKKWTIRGKFVRLNTTTVKISELPPSITYEKYEDYLDTLIDNKFIISYDDNCKDNIDYTIKFTRNELDKLKDDDLIKLLKLEETSTEIFSTLDEFGKLKIFENSTDIIKYFVNFRLTYYDKRKQFILNKLNREMKIIDNRIKFIKAIINNKLKINNIPKIEIISKIEIMKLDIIDDSYDYLLKMPIYSLTKEMYDKLEEEYKIKIIEIKKTSETNPKDMYILDLNELKKKFK